MKELLDACNRLVFIAPRPAGSFYTIEALSVAIQEEFVNAFGLLLCRDGMNEEFIFIHKHLVANPDLMFNDRFDHEYLIGQYLNLLKEGCLNGVGFTPQICVLEDEVIQGLNCLSKAIVLGSLVKGLGHSIKLCILPDHAMVLIETGEQNILCDIESEQCIFLSGAFVAHEGYQWYAASTEDHLAFRHMVVQDFELGIINAICDNFQFLKQSHGQELTLYEQKLVSIVDKKHMLWGDIAAIDWLAFQEEYFSPLNRYRIDYENDFLIDCAMNEEDHYVNTLGLQLDRTMANALLISNNRTDILFFHQEYKEFIFDVYEELAQALETGEGEDSIKITCPQVLGPYVYAFYRLLQKDLHLRRYFIWRTLKDVVPDHVVIEVNEAIDAFAET
jgi:hypothetical protein